MRGTADPQWASIGYNRSITSPRTLANVGLSSWLRDRFNTVIFRVTMSVIDLAFWFSQVRQCECTRATTVICAYSC